MDKLEELKLQVKEYNEQALVLQNNGKPEEAYEYYDKANALDSMYIETYINRANLYLKNEKYDEAEVNYKKALMINKNDGRIFFHLGNLSVLKGDTNAGIEYYNKAISLGYVAARLFYSMGLIYEETKNTDLSLRNFSKAIHLDGNVPEYRIHKASLQVTLGMYEEALTTLKETTSYLPDVYEGYHYSFVILCSLKRFEEAKNIIDKALSLFPGDPALVLDNIKYYTLTSQYDKALEMIEEARKMEGYQAVELELLIEQGKVYMLQNEFEKATEYLRKSEELVKDGGENAEALFLLMLIYAHNEKYELLLKCAERLSEMKTDNSFERAAFYYKPYALNKTGKKEEAKKYYKEAISYYRSATIKEPTLVDAYLFRALCHKELEDYVKALELADYVGLLLDSSEVHMVKSEIYHAMKDIEMANKEKDIAQSIDTGAVKRREEELV